MVLDSLIQFYHSHTLVVLFYLAIFMFVFWKRKRFDIYLKFIAMYRAKWGISLMDKWARDYRELIKLLGYIGIGIGFSSMVFIVYVLIDGLVTLFTTPNAPATVAPIIPGVQVPGVPAEFFIPLVQGVLAIFIIALIHEFAHGVVARAHNIRVKNTGVAIIGPFFAAFVEPEEKDLEKADDVALYSMIAAGSAINVVFAIFLLLIITSVITPLFGAFADEQGVSFSLVEDGFAASEADLTPDAVYTALGGQSFTTTAEFGALLRNTTPGDTIVLTHAQGTDSIVTRPHPDNPTVPHLGVQIQQHFTQEDSLWFGAVVWLTSFLQLTGALSLAIGAANMLPIGPLDGGRMMQRALQRIRGEKKGNKTLVKLSIILLIIILISLTPVIRETAKAIFS